MRFLRGDSVAAALRAEGFPLPAHVVEARVVVGVDQALRIQYDVLLTGEELAQFGRACLRLAAEGRPDDRG